MPATFVAALGASSYTYAEATATQSLPTGSDRTHARSPFSAACRRWLVSDNLKSGITKACFYEPAVQSRLCRDGGALPARRSCRRGPGSPRDKAKVEVAVQVATRWIIAKLRNRRSSRCRS